MAHVNDSGGQGRNFSCPTLGFTRSSSDDWTAALKSIDFDGCPSPKSEEPATHVLRVLTPFADPSVLLRLRREGLETAKDIAGLEKDDLRELGFRMLERSRILRWTGRAEYIRSGSLGGEDSLPIPPLPFEGAVQDEEDENQLVSGSGQIYVGNSCRPKRPSFDCDAMPGWHREALHRLEERIPINENLQPDDVETDRRLDEVEQRADFWCSIVTSVTPPPPITTKRVDRTFTGAPDFEVGDLRENILEELFDLSRERVEQLYWGMVLGSEGCLLGALRQGLHRCGLPELEDSTLEKIRKVVQASDGKILTISEFEAILSRLKLAQLLSGACRLPLDKETLGNRRLVLGQRGIKVSDSAAGELTVVDYCPLWSNLRVIPKTKHREFFFGHRSQPEDSGHLPLVRWVHMDGLDLTLLLALTVKYGLHPLCVEDVIEQCPTKVDRFGCHYFAAIEQLCLINTSDGSAPVLVAGRHVAIFCSGAPLFDTIVTVTEPDHDEKEDWPGGPVRDESGAGNAWVYRLRVRLGAAHSRIRERRAEFLMYQILDLSADELVKVTNAYATRLNCLEELMADTVSQKPLEEVSLAQLQLAVVTRRLKGLLRQIRRITEDPDLLACLTGYISDVKDHIEQAMEDATYLIQKCRTILETSERVLERRQRLARERAADELNTRVFALTVATAIFSPMHFITAVYGMNFVDAKGTATIPELLWPHGYEIFWCVAVIYLCSSSLCAMLVWCHFRQQTQKDYASILDSSSGKSRAPPSARMQLSNAMTSGATIALSS